MRFHRSHGLVLALLLTTPLAGQLTIPGADGSDGPLVVGTGVSFTIDQDDPGVVVGPWDTTAGTGSGVFDPDQRLFVLKYSSMDIQGNVFFETDGRNAPVMFLVSGSVNIVGSIRAQGEGGASATPEDRYSRPGPGGFRGAARGGAPGLGPGGGATGALGGFAGNGDSTGYGNDALLPLIGGSGGGSHTNYAGGAGGGAILIATPSSITLDGVIFLNGGARQFIPNNGSGFGSGGMCRLVADTITGTGLVSGAPPGYPPGRVRFETLSAAVSADIINNSTPAPIEVASQNPPTLVPPPSTIRCRIESVGGMPLPAEPTATMERSATDLFLTVTGQVEFVVITENLDPMNASVVVRVAARDDVQSITANATHVGPNGLGGEIWTVSIDVPDRSPTSFTALAKEL